MTRQQPNPAVAGPLTLLHCADVARWYEDIAPRLVRWLSGRGPVSAREAEDIVQDTFIRVIAHAPRLATFTDRQRRNYVFTIAANICSNGARTWHRHGETPVSLGAYVNTEEANTLTLIDPAQTTNEWMARAQPDAQPEQSTAARMTLRAVWDATPAIYRELLLLLAAEYTPAEIAAQWGVSTHAVEMRIWRMRQMLREAGERISA